MSQGYFPNSFKIAQVSQLLKKIGFDKDNPSNYRPISNLNNISKLFEWLILIRIQDHTISSTNLNRFQFAYQQFHSTDTALDCIFHSIDQGSSTVLVSLDLSAAFDTIDHSILFSRLNTSSSHTYLIAASLSPSEIPNPPFFLHSLAFPKVLYSTYPFLHLRFTHCRDCIFL